MLNILKGAFMSAVIGGSVALAAPTAQAATVEEVVSDKGIRAYLVHEPAVPMVAISFYFEGGSAFDPEGKAGTAAMTASLLDEGAGDLDSQAFRTALEDNAIRLTFDADRDGFAGNLRTLSDNLDLAVDLARSAMVEPRFDAEPVERIRAQLTARLNRRLNDPGTIARRTFFETAFPDHPYGRPESGTLESLATIDVGDLETFAGQQLALDKLHVGVSGDIDAAQLKIVLDRLFDGLPATTPAAVVPDVEPVAGEVVVVQQAVPQTVVTFGHRGIDRQHPDYYAAYIANYILGGGGFASRLLEEIREKRGLAYSAYSYLLQTEHSPLWLGGVSTNNDDVAESLRLVRVELERLKAGDISEPDLENAKTYLTGSFPLRLTSNVQVASMLVGMSVAELGPDYLDRRNNYIEAVSINDVRRVASELFDPDALLAVLVGQPKGLEG